MIFMRKNKAGLLLLCALLLSGCSDTGNAPQTDNGSDVTEAVLTEAPETETAAVTEEVLTVPEINEDFLNGSYVAKGRGKALASACDDELASDGKALKIYHRIEAWNGAEFNAEAFRGNTVDVAASLRSTAASVRVSIQYSVAGNVCYVEIFHVSTTEDKYSSGNGSFDIPDNADKIVIYIESDGLDDIYCDSFSVKVSGDYEYLPEPKELTFVDTSAYPSLKELYKDDFLMGIATTNDMMDVEDYRQLIGRQFNSMTLGNSFKPDSLLDRETTLSDLDKYMECPAVKFDNVKKELDFAVENGMTVRGHTLVWHSQTPGWIFYKDYDPNGELADRELMLKRMENYIKTVVTWADENYPGLVSCWDVVNEAADDGGGMRKSLWYETVGEDFVQRAFEYARKYAPEGTKLFYNDYNSYQNQKQKDIIEMLTPIIADGNIDGMGMQSHINTDISVPIYMTALKKYADLGLEVHVTELDIAAKKSADNWREDQGEYFRKFMSELLKFERDGVNIKSVTIWGLNDCLSWKAADLPLLFDDDLSKKPAFDGVVQAAEDAKTE